MEYLPLFTRVQGRRCLLVGGGGIALRKARLLRQAGAVLVVVAPEVSAELTDLVEASGGEIKRRRWQPDDLDGVALVIAATAAREVNAAVSAAAQARQLPVNVVDDPALCSVVLPSIIDRSPIVVAISSGGQSPVLARRLRARLESWIPAGYGRLAALLGRFRAAAVERFPAGEQRRHFWEEVLDGPVAEMLLAGREEQAIAALEAHLRSPDAARIKGEVFLVGAGPGDPDLLTFKALRLMQRADVVLYDRLVTPEILALCRRDAEQIYVGKARAAHALPQAQINRLLADLALQGKKVLRLKGGDPFIFGRGGEEIELLAGEGVPFQVVPGITAAAGCASYAGIPLTHRDHAQSVRFVTGHLKDGTTNLPWDELVQPAQTVVFYMGLVGLPVICRELMAHGRAPATPIALIQQGTTPHQRVIAGTLADMPERVAAAAIKPPTLIIVGEVVSLHAKLRWFDGAGSGHAPAPD